MKKRTYYIDFQCVIAKDGYEWKTVKGVLPPEPVEYIRAKTKKLTTKPLPNDAYTRFCELGWELKKEGADKKKLILDNVHEFGTLWGTELYFGKAERIPRLETFPQVKNYEKLSTWLYETRLDIANGFIDKTIDRISDSDIYENTFHFVGYNHNETIDHIKVKKVKVGRKLELVYCPTNLIGAIDLQFTLNLGFTNYNKVCEQCKKPFQSSRADARFCQGKSTCKVNFSRNKKKRRKK